MNLKFQINVLKKCIVFEKFSMIITICLLLLSISFSVTIRIADDVDNSNKALHPTRLEALQKFVYTHFGFENGLC